MRRIYIIEDNPIAAAMDRDRLIEAGYEASKRRGAPPWSGDAGEGGLYTVEACLDADTILPQLVRDIPRIAELPQQIPLPEMAVGHSVLSYRSLSIDRTARLAYLSGCRVDFRAKEFDILLYLAERPNQIVGREALYRAVWDEEPICADATITEHIRRIRIKLERPGAPRFIETVRCRGYRFCA